jgi:hypothetical protein
MLEQESKRVEAQISPAAVPLPGDPLWTLSEEFSRPCTLHPARAKKQYWCLDKDWAARRRLLLLDALKRCSVAPHLKRFGPAGESPSR